MGRMKDLYIEHQIREEICPVCHSVMDTEDEYLKQCRECGYKQKGDRP